MSAANDAVTTLLSLATTGLLTWAVRISSTVHTLRERIARLEQRADDQRDRP